MRLLALKKGNRPPFIVLKKENRAPLIDWMGLFGGVVERFVALTLVLIAPAYLPAFIGGWVLLKFAIGWQREREGKYVEEREVDKQSFLALIGNVISFAIPIAVGLVLYPEALNAWATRQ
jgi:hypothetical protein